MHGGSTGTGTRSFNDSRRLSFTKWANNVPGIPDQLKGGGGEMIRAGGKRGSVVEGKGRGGGGRGGLLLGGEEVRGEY